MKRRKTVVAKKKKVTAKKPVQKKSTAKKKPAKKSVKKVVKIAKPKAQKKSAAKKVAPKNVKKAVIDYSKAVTPLGNRIVVRLISTERITPGGLIIPDMVKTEQGQLKAEVLAVGSGAKNKKGHVRPLDVQKGDVVLFSEFSGTKVVFNSEELHIVQETDVLGILQK